MNRTEWRETISVNGVSVDIVATGSDGYEWELRIENEHRISTHWDEFFDTADAALAAGRKAVETEGIEAFSGFGEFGYLEDSPEQRRLQAAIKELLGRRKRDKPPK